MKRKDENWLQELVDSALTWSKADVSMAILNNKSKSNVEFDEYGVQSSLECHDAELTLYSRFGQRQGMACTNQFDTASLKQLAKRAEFVAKVSSPDKMLPKWPQRMKVKTNEMAFASAMLKLTPSEQMNLVDDGLRLVRGRRIEARGWLDVQTQKVFMKSSQKINVQHHQSDFAFSFYADATRQSGGRSWAGRFGNNLLEANLNAAIDYAMQRALIGVNATSLSRGHYNVILEPQALSALLTPFLANFNRRQVNTGMSYFSRLGQGGLDRRFHLFSDPFYSLAPSIPWCFNGKVLEKTDYVREGKVVNFMEAGHKGDFLQVPNLIVSGTGQSPDALIRKTDKGLLITGLEGVQSLDHHRTKLTGISQGSCFAIEDGKLVHAIKRFRFVVDLLQLLGNIQAYGQQERVRSSLGIPLVLPGIKVGNFRVSEVFDEE